MYDDFEKDKKRVLALKKNGIVHGLGKIRLEDQQRIKNLIGVAANSDPEKAAQQTALEEENKQLWQIKDKCMKNVHVLSF